MLLCLWVFCANAQNKATEVSIYGEDGKTVIGKVIIDANSKTNLLLLHTAQKTDTAGNKIITFYLGNKATTPLLDARILMKFSKPVIEVMPSFSAAFNSINGLAEDHMTYTYKAGRLERDPGSVVIISFSVKSKGKVITEISGLDGVMP
jgi:hypothetical protein